MQINKTFLALLLVVFVAMGCAGSKANSKNCGCEAKKGMTGY